MKARAQIRLLPDGRRLHLHDGPIDLIVEAFGETERDQRRLSRGGRALRRPCSTNSAASLHFCDRPARRDGPLPVGRDRETNGGGSCTLLRADFHHAHGGRGRCSRRRNSGRHDGSGQSFARLRQQRRRHRAASCARRAFRRGHGRAAGSSIAFRHGHAGLGAAGARHRDQRLARPQFLARHRRRGDGSRRPCRHGGRRRNHHRQRRGPARTSGSDLGFRRAILLPTATLANGS